MTRIRRMITDISQLLISVKRTNMKITILQTVVDENNVTENHNSALKLIAAVPGSDLIILPELFVCGYNRQAISECAGKSLQLVMDYSDCARQKGSALITGSMALVDNGRIYNRSLFFDRTGEVITAYNKIHLFKLMQEDEYFSAGNRIIFADYKGWRIGFLICYDLRFPELAGILAQKGCNLLVIPSAWPANRIAVFKQLAIARAIENQLWVAAVNRASAENRTTYGGNSLIIAPSGEIIAEAGLTAQTICAELDLDRVTEYRKTIPCISDRRHDLYELVDKTNS